jgi:putative glutamine amidotransferase
MPHSTDHEYSQRAIPQYERAVTLAEAEPVRIALDQPTAEVLKLIKTCDAILLPGSNADVDPARFNQPRSPHTAAADPRRDEVDMLLLEDAYANRKPILGICYGLQSLNVFRKGSLIQHIPDFLPEETRNKINHEAGKAIPVAHTVEVAVDSKLASIVTEEKPSHPVILSEAGTSEANPRAVEGSLPPSRGFVLNVNSSHHQSAGEIGTGLRIVARCPDDSIIEALEGTSPDHFVVAVQWHPERSVEEDAASRAIFQALTAAATNR